MAALESALSNAFASIISVVYVVVYTLLSMLGLGTLTDANTITVNLDTDDISQVWTAETSDESIIKVEYDASGLENGDFYKFVVTSVAAGDATITFTCTNALGLGSVVKTVEYVCTVLPNGQIYYSVANPAAA